MKQTQTVVSNILFFSGISPTTFAQCVAILILNRRDQEEDRERPSAGRPSLNLKRRNSNTGSDSSSRGSNASPVKQVEKEPSRDVVKHHYIRTLEEFVTNPGSPTKAEAVSIQSEGERASRIWKAL